MQIARKLNAFEKLLLLTGIAIGVVGFVFIHFIFIEDGRVMTWDMLTVVFLWLILIFVVIQSAIQENTREETGTIIHKHSEETRLLRRITEELHEEIRLMRVDIGYTHNKIVDSHRDLLHHTKSAAKKTTKKRARK